MLSAIRLSLDEIDDPSEVEVVVEEVWNVSAGLIFAFYSLQTPSPPDVF